MEKKKVNMGELKELNESQLKEILPDKELPAEGTEGSEILPHEADFDRLFERIDAENTELHKAYLQNQYEQSVAEGLEDDDTGLDELVDGYDEDVNIEKRIHIKNSPTDNKDIEEKKDEEEVSEKVEDEILIDTNTLPKVKFNKPEVKHVESDKIVIEKTLDDEFDADLSDLEDDDTEVVKIDKEDKLNNMDVDLSDLEDDNHVTVDSEVDEAYERLKREATEKISPIDNVVDLSKFKISTKVKKTPSLMLRNAVKSNFYTWVCSISKKPITMSEMTGTEIMNLNRDSGDNTYAYVLNMLNTIFDHIISPKPDTMLEWAKTMPTNDLNDIFFAIYGAVYGKSNRVYTSCDKDGVNGTGCGNAWVTHSLDMSELYETKHQDEIDKILNTEVTKYEASMIDVTLLQVTDDWAFALKQPSIYNSYIEPHHLGTEINKYDNILHILMCIDSIYYINGNTNELEEIEFKSFNNPEKRTKAKYRQLKKFLDALTSDQTANLTKAINEIIEESNNQALATYQLPGGVCPKCGNKIEPTTMSADELLFIRLQLGNMRN